MRFKVASIFYLIFVWIIQIKETFIANGFGALQFWYQSLGYDFVDT